MADATHDLHDLVQLTLEALRAEREDPNITPQTRKANEYLVTKLLNYKALMRTRVLDGGNYEFLLTPDGKHGWYYKPNNSAAFNWIGPYTSRKEAVAAKLAQRQKSSGIKTPLNVIDREIFGS